MKLFQKRIRLSLRTKLTLLIGSFVIVIVVITGIITTMREKETLEDELTRRGLALASDLAQFLVRPIINHDLPTLRRFVNHTMEQDYVHYVVVLDTHGRVLMHSDLDEVNKTYKDSLSIAAMKSNEPGFTEVNFTPHEKEHSDIEILMPIAIKGVRLGTVRLGYCYMAIEKEMAKAQQQIVLIGLLTVAGGGVVAFLLATFISAPIKRITDATESVARGNLNPQLEIKRDDEIGTLASAFNRMTEDLQRTTVSKDYFDNIIESMNDTLVVVSVDGKIKDVNKATCDLLGYSEDELIGRDIYLIVPQEEEFFRNTEFESMVEQSTPITKEVNYLAKSGKQIPMLFSAAVLKSKEGKIEGVVCIARDITERKRFEEALQESEERSKAKFKGVPIPTYSWQNIDDDFVLVDYNDAAEEITKGKIAQWIGVKLSEMYKDMPQVIEDVWKCFHNKAIIGTEMPYKFKTVDKEAYLNVYYSYVPPDFVLVHTEDITERRLAEEALKESEKKYRDLVENIDDVVYVVDRKGTLSYVSPAIESFLGYHPSEVLGHSLSEYVYHEDLPFLKTNLEKIFSGEISSNEYRLLAKSGEICWSLTSSRPTYDGDRVIGIYGLLSNITETKRAEEALRRSEGELRFLSSQLLKAQEQERRRLSIELHDELGQDLMVLKLKMRAIQERMHDESVSLTGEFDEVLGYLKEVAENVRRISRDLSPSILEDLGLTAAIRWLVAAFTKHSNIESLLDMTEIDNLFSHEGQIIIYRIIQECLTNIAKHSHATSVSISIKKMDEDVIFNIEDDGKGFNIQEAFTRDPSLKGLGLATMYERIRMLRGTFYIMSNEGGTKIIFSIPLSVKGKEE
jgi:PAS domain S-box-containing protein